MNWGLFFVSLLVALLFLVGLIGTVVPAVPGVVLIFAGTLLFALVDHFQRVTGWTIVLFGGLTVAAVAADFVASAVGARRYQAGRWGVAGALLGMIVGLFFGLPGMILGPPAGATILELIGGRGTREALRAGWGTLVGYVGSVVFKLGVGFAIIGVFTYSVLAYALR